MAWLTVASGKKNTAATNLTECCGFTQEISEWDMET